MYLNLVAVVITIRNLKTVSNIISIYERHGEIHLVQNGQYIVVIVICFVM